MVRKFVTSETISQKKMNCINNVAEVKLIHTSKNWQVRISLISRDSNRVADRMTKEARGNLDQLSNFYDPYIVLRRILEANIHHALSTKAIGD